MVNLILEYKACFQKTKKNKKKIKVHFDLYAANIFLIKQDRFITIKILY